jgi:molybdenum cofactor biosynthesis enzyme MoaA
MKIQTFSILCGTAACDARCPFCVSKMTYKGGVNMAPTKINWHNFRCAKMLAKRSGVTTVMLTGKGEPTLYPDDVGAFIRHVGNHFPFVELQTNGIGIGNGRVGKRTLEYWQRNGLTTLVLSVSHWKDSENKSIYVPHQDEYPSLKETIAKAHDVGLSIRLNCILLKGMVDDWDKVSALIDFARVNEVEQLTLMPVNWPKRARDIERQNLVKEKLELPSNSVTDIWHALKGQGNLLMELAHGACVYDVDGQNVCLSNCLSHKVYEDKSLMRNLIFFPDGHLRYDWEYKGAILL